MWKMVLWAACRRAFRAGLPLALGLLLVGKGDLSASDDRPSDDRPSDDRPSHDRPSDDRAAEAHAVPVINGDLGPCSLQFTINDRAGKPVYAAKIRVHIAYGFASAHKLDLEVSTNVDGKARFEGLPNRVKRPLRYEASEGDRQGLAIYDPADNCKDERVLVIAKPENDAAMP